MFCTQCGMIIGREALKEIYKCPKCDNVIKVASLVIVDEVVENDFLVLDGSQRKLCGLFLSEAMSKFFLSQKTPRAREWLPLFMDIEEERMKAFAKKVGWLISGIYKDPGPAARESERPFAKLASDIQEGAVNAILITDFTRVARKDLFDLQAICRPRSVPVFSIYPHRFDENLALENFDYDAIPDEEAESPLFEKYWNERCDRLIEEEIQNMRWFWTYYIADLLVKEIGVDAVKAWRKEDPLCLRLSWKDALTRLAIARMKKISLLPKLPLPRVKNCEICKRRFLETTLPLHLLEIARFKVRFCRSCLGRAFFFDETSYRKFLAGASREEIRDFDEGIKVFQDVPWDKLLSFIKTAIEKPPGVADRCKSDTWLRLLIESEILTAFGPLAKHEAFYRAEDGHPCLNVGTVLVDNFLSRNGIRHRIEIKYPKHLQFNDMGTLRGDFQIGDSFVEYLGFRGQDEFRKKPDEREEICRRNGLRLIRIYTEDLLSLDIHNRKFRHHLPRPEAEAGAEGEAKTEADSKTDTAPLPVLDKDRVFRRQIDSGPVPAEPVKNETRTNKA